MKQRHIAILVDGAFFLKRLPKLVQASRCDTPEHITACLRHVCRSHVQSLTDCPHKEWNSHVYRIFFYDASPYTGKSHHPTENRPIDFAKSEVALQRLALFDCLKRQRKFALRLGKVNWAHDWTIAPKVGKKLLRERSALEAFNDIENNVGANGDAQVSLTAEQVQALVTLRDLCAGIDGRSVSYGLRQKGVDIRIGIDIASLALKKQVDTIILVSGDSDFVPAAKLARREGVDFILDPLWQQVNADLFEHIDGLQSGLSKPGHPQRPDRRRDAAAQQEDQSD